MLIFGFQTLCYDTLALLIILEFKSPTQTLTLTETHKILWSD